MDDTGENYAACCDNLHEMLIGLDTVIRVHGHDEKELRHYAGLFVWRLTQATLSHQTQSDWSDVGTFFKFANEPGISHLISEFHKKPFPQTPK